MVFLLGFAPVSNAQDVFTPPSTGSMALLFEFDGLNTLRANAFDGGLGFKMFFAPNMAFRGSLQFAHASSDIPANPGAGQTGSDGDESGTTFGISAALELHLASRRVSPYIGGGVAFSSTSTEENTPTVGNQVKTTVKNRIGGVNINQVTFTAGTQFSVFAMVGAELFIIRELSLAAEYQLGYTKFSQSDQEVTQGATTVKTTGPGSSSFGIQSQGVFTLAFYF